MTEGMTIFFAAVAGFVGVFDIAALLSPPITIGTLILMGIFVLLLTVLAISSFINNRRS